MSMRSTPDTTGLVARTVAAAKAAAGTLEHEASAKKRSAQIAKRREHGFKRAQRDAAIAPTWARLPLLHSIWMRLAKVEERQESLRKLASDAAALSVRELESYRSLKHQASRARQIGKRLASLERELRVLELGQASEGVRERARHACQIALQSRSRDVGAFEEAANALADMARDLLRLREVRAGRLAQRTPYREKVNWPVYLPITASLRSLAKGRGALIDKSDPYRGSNIYVPPMMDLSPFEEFLPLAYRRQPLNMTFHNIRYGASGQNMHTLFTNKTWSYIRHANYDKTGRRCILCGRRSGKMASFLRAPESEGSVDCHELWEWFVPDNAVPVGIQRMTGLVVVCFECHMTHHEGFARSLARQHGAEAEDAVRRAILKKRCFITRMRPVDVAQEMREERDRLRSMTFVKTWIIDLHHLSLQDNLRGMVPVMLEPNTVKVPPEIIAGLAFTTTKGRNFPATPAQEIYQRERAKHVAATTPLTTVTKLSPAHIMH